MSVLTGMEAANMIVSILLEVFTALVEMIMF